MNLDRIYIRFFIRISYLKMFRHFAKKIIKIGKEEEKKNPEEVRKQVYDELCVISNNIMNNLTQL